MSQCSAVCEDDLQMHLVCQFSMLYSTRGKLIWQLGPDVFFEVCLRPAALKKSAHVYECPSRAGCFFVDLV